MLLVNKLGSRAPLLSTSRAGPVLAGWSREAGSPSALLLGEARGPSKAQLGPGDMAHSGNRRCLSSHVTHSSLSPSGSAFSLSRRLHWALQGPPQGSGGPGQADDSQCAPSPPALPQDHAMTSQPGGHWTPIAATTHSCREGEAFFKI